MGINEATGRDAWAKRKNGDCEAERPVVPRENHRNWSEDPQRHGACFRLAMAELVTPQTNITPLQKSRGLRSVRPFRRVRRPSVPKLSYMTWGRGETGSGSGGFGTWSATSLVFFFVVCFPVFLIFCFYFCRFFCFSEVKSLLSCLAVA